MSKKTIQIDENLHQEVAEFCKLNSIKANDFYTEAIKNWLQLSKFGDAPFFEPPTVNVKLPGEIKKVEVSFKLNDEDSPTQITTEAMQEALDNKLYKNPVEATHGETPKEEVKETPKPRKRRL